MVNYVITKLTLSECLQGIIRKIDLNLHDQFSQMRRKLCGTLNQHKKLYYCNKYIAHRKQYMCTV